MADRPKSSLTNSSFVVNMHNQSGSLKHWSFYFQGHMCQLFAPHLYNHTVKKSLNARKRRALSLQLKHDDWSDPNSLDRKKLYKPSLASVWWHLVLSRRIESRTRFYEGQVESLQYLSLRILSYRPSETCKSENKQDCWETL